MLDYRREDFTRTSERYDVILDLVAHRSVFAYRRALTRSGWYRCVGGSVPTLLRLVTAGWMLGQVTGRSIGVLAVRPGPASFEPLAALCVAGDVKIHTHRSVTLEEVPAALAEVGEGHALGKVVIDLSRP